MTDRSGVVWCCVAPGARDAGYGFISSNAALNASGEMLYPPA
jgi:hypothetical protein